MQQSFVQQFVVRQTGAERLHFRFGRQTSVNQQPCRFDERHFFRDGFNRDSPIAQDSPFPVHIGDFTGAGRGVAQSGIERRQPRFRAQFRNVDAHFTRSGTQYRQFDRSAAVFQPDRFFRHLISFIVCFSRRF